MTRRTVFTLSSSTSCALNEVSLYYYLQNLDFLNLIHHYKRTIDNTLITCEVFGVSVTKVLSSLPLRLYKPGLIYDSPALFNLKKCVEKIVLDMFYFPYNTTKPFVCYKLLFSFDRF